MTKFKWLIGSSIDFAKLVIRPPHYLYQYYINGKNYYDIDNDDDYRINIRVENGIIIDINE